MSWWGDITGQTQADAAREAANMRAQGYSLAYNRAIPELNAGLNNAQTLYDKARALYDPYAKAGQTGLTTYLGSLGLGTPEDRAAAVSAFQTGPGYQFAVDEAGRAIERSAAARGNLASGNTLAALNDRAVGMANQEYGNWQNRLAGLGTMGMQATGAQANNLTGLGGLAYDTGSNKARLGWDMEKGMMDVRAQGLQEAAAAKAAGSANLASLGMGVGNLFMGGLGSMGGLGGLISGGYSLFGGGMGNSNIGNPLSISGFY